MTQIRHFVVETTSDLRGGRQSWRVLSMLWSAALWAYPGFVDRLVFGSGDNRLTTFELHG
jgi:hypothetical protein